MKSTFGTRENFFKDNFEMNLDSNQLWPVILNLRGNNAYKKWQRKTIKKKHFIVATSSYPPILILGGCSVLFLHWHRKKCHNCTKDKVFH